MLSPRAPLARTNPVSRVGASLLATAPLLVSFDWVSATVAIVVQLVLLLAGGVHPGTLLRRTLPLVAIAPLGALSMLLYGEPDGRIWWEFGFAIVSDRSIRLAIAMALRIVAIGLPFMALWLDIDPTDLGDGLAQVVRLPARFVLGTLAAVRMVSLFRNDWRALGQARRARGLGDTGRLRRYVTMAFALLVFALRRGGKLALAMEARGFGRGARTWARPSRVGLPDVVCLLLALLVPVLALGAAVGAGTFEAVLT